MTKNTWSRCGLHTSAEPVVLLAIAFYPPRFLTLSSLCVVVEHHCDVLPIDAIHTEASQIDGVSDIIGELSFRRLWRFSCLFSCRSVIVNGTVEVVKPDGQRLDYKLGDCFGAEPTPNIQVGSSKSPVSIRPVLSAVSCG